MYLFVVSMLKEPSSFTWYNSVKVNFKNSWITIIIISLVWAYLVVVFDTDKETLGLLSPGLLNILLTLSLTFYSINICFSIVCLVGFLTCALKSRLGRKRSYGNPKRLVFGFNLGLIIVFTWTFAFCFFFCELRTGLLTLLFFLNTREFKVVTRCDWHMVSITEHNTWNRNYCWPKSKQAKLASRGATLENKKCNYLRKFIGFVASELQSKFSVIANQVNWE